MAELPQDRRQAPRYSFDAQATISTSDGQEIIPVKVLSLGIRGCRIEVKQRLLVDQELELTILLNGDKIIGNVVVVYYRSGGFAGLHFTTMSEEMRKRLERLVAYVAKTFGEEGSSSPPRVSG